MKLTIGGKEYTFKFSVDASLNDECVEKTTGLMMKVAEAHDERDIDLMLHSVSNIPMTALSVFYAGLLEYHGMGRDADHSIRSKEDAKELIKTYFEENPDSEDANFFGILNMMVEQMNEDGFFKLVGLESLMQTETPENGTVKTPMDHLPKQRKKTTGN